MGKIFNFEREKSRTTVTETEYSFRKRKPKPLRDCQCKRILVDEEARSVECRDCGAILDPLKVLVEYANEQRKTAVEIARYRAGREEFIKIWHGLSWTQKERRQVGIAMDGARIDAIRAANLADELDKA